MLTQMLEFELTYDPIKRKLTLVDFNPPNREGEKPFKISFTEVKSLEQLKVAIGAWITLKEDNEKNRCKNENG